MYWADSEKRRFVSDLLVTVLLHLAFPNVVRLLSNERTWKYLKNLDPLTGWRKVTIFPLPSSPPVSSAGSAWQSGMQIQFAHSAGKLRTNGVTTPSHAYVGETALAATPPFETFSTTSPATAALWLQSRRNASCHPAHPMTVTRPFRPRPLPPCRYLGPTRPLVSARGLGLLDLQCPLPLQLVQSRLGLGHGVPACRVSQIPLPRHRSTGLLFRPLVFEAVGGGWSGGLGFLSCWVARESRRSTSLPSSDPSLSFAQRISATLHRGNARAILKRSPEGLTPDRSSLGLQVFAEDLAWITCPSPCRFPSPSPLSPLSFLFPSPISSFLPFSLSPLLPFVPSLLLFPSLFPPPLLSWPSCPFSTWGSFARCSVRLSGRGRGREGFTPALPPWLWLIQGISVVACFFLLALPFIRVLKGMDVVEEFLVSPAVSVMFLSINDHAGSLKGLIHALEGHFRSLHDEICIGAHMRLTEVPTCQPARLWLEVASCFSGSSSSLSAFAFLG